MENEIEKRLAALEARIDELENPKEESPDTPLQLLRIVTGAAITAFVAWIVSGAGK